MLTPAEWERVLKGRRVRFVLDEEQANWAGKNAKRCMSCDNASDVKGDPRRGWCLVHQMAVSDAYPVMCQFFEQAK